MTPLARVARAALALVALLALAFGVAAPPERCPSATPAELRASAQAAIDWFARNQDPDGSWLYLYDKDKNTAAPEYNVVRHTGAAMGLYQAAAAGLPRALGSADRGTRWALDRLIERDGWSAVTFGTVDTGATALLVAGLSVRRDATGDTRYDRVLRRLGRFLVAQTEPSGAVLASYDPSRGAPVRGEYSKYFTGEAYWALARLHRDFPAGPWGRVADRIGAYLATRRDSAEHHWPPIEDHWAAYGLAATVHFPERGEPPLTDDELGYARRQAEWFGVDTRWTNQRMGPWGVVVRGTHTPRGGGYGVLGEGLTGLWRSSLHDPRMGDLRAPLAERAACIGGLAVDAQSNAADAAHATRPDRVEGAWFRDGETRMDDQQHALAALIHTIPIAETRAAADEGSSSQPDHQTPSAWLWAAVLILAMNPVRAAFGIPRPRPGSSPAAVELAALGGAIGAVAVCAASAVAPPLLDALDVSDPAFRIAAGIVALLVGAADLFRHPPTPEPALPGRRAALVPVAIPVVARPALLVIALGAGADHGVLLATASMVIAVVLLILITGRAPTDGPHGRALRWAARLLAAALVAGGVLLSVDGIYDV
jgi:small neutral amino acid transporter SnatA (MarC family)